MRTDIDLEKLRKVLQDRKRDIELSKESQKQDGAPKELDQTRVGRLSRMDAMQQQAMSKAAANPPFAIQP